MKSFLSMPEDRRITHLVLGKFDGMHLAHKELFKHLGESGAVLCIESGGELLTLDKELYCDKEMIFVEFSDIKEWNGAYFVKKLKEKFRALEKLVVGYDFCFGKNRAWNAEDLADLFGGEVIIVPEFCIKDQGVHSSVIKQAIKQGDMKNAKALLGRYYHIQGRVVKGQNLGSTQLYATINIETSRYVLPQNGVYASFTKLQNRIYKSVCFVGHRLSTDGAFSIETHIIDKDFVAEDRISVDSVSVCFIEKIRDNRTFSDLGELKSRIAKDISQAHYILDSASLAFVEM